MIPFRLRPHERRALEGYLGCTRAADELCRAQALLWLHQGQTAAQVAELLRVSRQTIYNWTRRFLQRRGLDLPARLRDAPRSGRPPTASGVIDPLIAGVIGEDPRGHGYRYTVWTAPLLRRHLRDAHRIETSEKSVRRAIARLGLRWKRPRDRLALRPATWRQAKGGSNAG